MPIYLGNQSVQLRNIGSGGGSGNTNSVALTQTEYDALTTEEKNNGTIYFITDGVADNIIVNDSVPIGAIQAYGGATAPTGWLICDGSAVSRTTYSELFEAIGTTYGTGDGSTTFNIPDLRGRVAIGQSTTYGLGVSGGEATHVHSTGNHTLTLNEIPSHAHGYQKPVLMWGSGANAAWPGSGTTAKGSDQWGYSGTANAGGGGAHNHGNTGSSSNMQPYLATNYIIKAKNNSPTETALLPMLDMFYPVGSYYETSDSTFNPNTAWGGTWVREAEGLVHIGSGTNYAVGTTGGEKTHTLTVNEMPSHNHKATVTANTTYANGTNWAKVSTSGTSGLGVGTTVTIDNKGGDQAHNNMQPYIVVNRWHRTA